MNLAELEKQLRKATLSYEAALGAAGRAAEALNSARCELETAQSAVDEFMAGLRSEAPLGSYWRRAIDQTGGGSA